MVNPFKWITTGYHAIEGRGRRRAPRSRTYHEDKLHKQKQRITGAAAAREAVRNFALTRWAVNKHLDYVAAFSFQAKTGDTALDATLEGRIADWSDRQRCDVARRHPLKRMIRLAEARRIVDGDMGLLKVLGQPRRPGRGALQAIESDRIHTPRQMPEPFDAAEFINGVKTAVGGAAQQYCICKRADNGALEFSRVVPASSMFFHACYDRFDQVRGVSPLLSALNSMTDVYEGFDLALAKIKVSQILGLATFRGSDDSLGAQTGADVDGDGQEEQFEVDFGKGPIHLDLDEGDDAKILDAKTPATETVAFLNQMMAVSLKALDIPYSFFDESHTTFNGSHRAEIGYVKSCNSKRADLAALLNEITAWRIGLMIADGELSLPRGMRADDLAWEWVPDGIPWWNPAQQVKGQTMAIGAALTDYQRACREAGTDFYENVDRIAEQQAYARSKNVKLTLAGVMGTDATPTESQGGDDE